MCLNVSLPFKNLLGVLASTTRKPPGPALDVACVSTLDNLCRREAKKLRQGKLRVVQQQIAPGVGSCWLMMINDGK